MDRMKGWRKRLRAFFRRGAVEREMNAELSFHLEMEARRNIEAGMSANEARTAALLAFGGVDRFTEDVRDVRRFRLLDDAWHDARHAMRSFRRTPGFAAAAILTLALGSGASTAVFSVVHAVLLKPLPYAEPQRIVRLWESNATQGVDHGKVSPGTFADIRDRSRTLENIALMDRADLLYTVDNQSAELRRTSTSSAFFDILGVKPVIGRTFSSPDTTGSDADAEAVIAYDVWQTYFGGARDVIGRSLRQEGRRLITVIGVMPRGFDYPDGSQLWTREDIGSSPGGVMRQFRYHDAIAKIRAGTSDDVALAELTAIAGSLQHEYPASNAGWTVQMSSLTDSITGNMRPAIVILFLLVTCLLIIACANVASLAVARTTARSQEIGIRMAIGAARGRLIAQWIVEGCVLATAGALGGIVLAWVAIRAMHTLAPADMPRLDEINLTLPVLGFTLLIALFTAFASGAAPALQLHRLRGTHALRTAARAVTRETMRARELLNAAEVALTLVLLVCGSLLLSTFVRLRNVDLGFRSHSVMSAALHIPMGRFTDPRPWPRLATHYQEILIRVRNLPGVTAAAGITSVPLTGEAEDGSLWRSDAPGAHGRRPPASAADQWKAKISVITPGYFDVMSIPVIRGRAFTDADAFTVEQMTNPELDKPVGAAIVNAEAARRFWPGQDPVGQRIFLFDDQTFASSRTVVGVAGDVRSKDVALGAAPEVYMPMAQHPGMRLSIVVATTLPPATFNKLLTSTVHDFDAQVSVSRVEAMTDVVSGAVSRPRFNAILVGSFAAIALALSATGIFGVMAYLVTLRTNEIGIRMALGARRTGVVSLILAAGMRSVVGGIAVGTVASVAAAIGLRSLLFGFAPLEAVNFLIAQAILFLTCLAAGFIPAARASRLDPVEALRKP